MVELLGVERLVALLMRVVLIDIRIVKLVGVRTVCRMLVTTVFNVVLGMGASVIPVIGAKLAISAMHVMLENSPAHISTPRLLLRYAKIVGQERLPVQAQHHVINVGQERLPVQAQDHVLNVGRERLPVQAQHHVINVGRERLPVQAQHHVLNVGQERLPVQAQHHVLNVRQERLPVQVQDHVHNVGRERLPVQARHHV